MIIKRNQRSQIPTLKRCIAVGAVGASEAAAGEDDGGGERQPKRRRKGDEFFPVELLGHVPASGIPYAEFGFRWCEEEPEVASPSPAASSPAPTRPPVVRTSRGRTQTLPSRFNDSVLIDPWKKEKQHKTKPIDELMNPRFDKSEEKFEGKFDEFGYRDQCFGAEFVNSMNSSVLFGDEDEEERYRACRNLSSQKYDRYGNKFSNKYSKYSTSRSTLTSVHKGPAMLGYYYSLEMPVDIRDDDDELEVVDMEDEEEEEEEEEGFHLVQEFSFGDVVWAKIGKRHPIWPSMVVDPMQQPAEAIPSLRGNREALCVMIFGWCAEFGNVRVIICVAKIAWFFFGSLNHCWC